MVAVAAVTSCSSSADKAGEKYPEQVRTNFVNGCSAKLPAGFRQNCECILQQIEKRYSLTDYIKVESDIKAGRDVSAFLAFTDSARQTCFPKK